MNDLVLQDTIIRNHDDPEPEGTGYSCTNAHACDQEMLQMRPDPFIFQYGNAHYIPAGSVHDNVCDLERYFLTDSPAWDLERVERQPNPSIYNIESGYWVFITIFSFLFLAHVFYWAPYRIPPLLGASFWISPLLAGPSEILTLLEAPFGISTLLGGMILLIFILSRI